MSSRSWRVLAAAVVLGAQSVLVPAAHGAPRARIVEATHIEAGEVEPDRVLNYTFTLTNAGDATLAIEDLAATCYCTTAKSNLWDIPPGQSATIQVRIDPSDFVGPINKGVEIKTNDPANPVLLVDVDLTVRPGIAVVPPELDFGSVGAQGSKSLQVDIKAPKTREFKIVAVKSDVAYLETAHEPLTLDDRHGAMLFVKVLPGAPPGAFKATVNVQTSDPSRPTIAIPVRGRGPGGLAANPEKLTFAMAAAGDDVGTVDISGTGPVQVRCTSESLVAAVEARKEGGYRVRVKVADGARSGRVMAKLVVSSAGDGAQELEVPVMGIIR